MMQINFVTKQLFIIGSSQHFRVFFITRPPVPTVEMSYRYFNGMISVEKHSFSPPQATFTIRTRHYRVHKCKSTHFHYIPIFLPAIAQLLQVGRSLKPYHLDLKVTP